VQLKVVGRDEYSFIKIADPVPAGFEVVNPRINQNTNLFDYGYFQFRDFIDGYLTFFSVSLLGTEQTYSYYLRAVIPGDYQVLPARAELMYSPSTYGTSGVNTISIKEIE